MAGTVSYSAYVWRNLGFKGFTRPAVAVPLGALVGGWVGYNWVANNLRELTWSSSRHKMVAKYNDQLGSKFLLDVLEPTFRLP